MLKTVKRSMPAFFLIICLIMSGCGSVGTGIHSESANTSQNLPASNAGGTTDAGGTAAPDVSDNTEVVVTDKPVIIADNIKTGILGNVKFAVDEANSASGDFKADGKALSLKITDSTGLTWQLVIPDNALAEKQTIKMTALNEVKSDTLGAITGGVMLEPDGLQFYSPATLTVTGSGIKKNGLILTARNDGSNMDFAYNVPSDSGLTAKIFHFSSTVAVDDPTTLQQLQGTALNQYKAAENAAKELLKEPIQAPSEPPSISLKCKEDKHEIDDTGFQEYLDAFMKPEMPIIEALNAAGSANQLVGGEQFDFTLSKRVMSRLLKKADMLMQTYQPQREKLYAVANVVLKMIKYYALVNTGSSIDESAYMKPLGQWAKKAADSYLEDLREKHDYKAAPAVFRAIHYAELLDGGSIDSGAYLEKLENALTFKVTFNTTIKGDLNYTLEGKIPVTLKIGEVFSGDGKGSGEYTSFSAPDTQLDMPNTFEVNVMVKDFDPCVNKTMDIFVDRFGAEKETLIVDGYRAPTTGVVQPSMLALFNDLADQSNGSYFKFNVALKNNEEIAADEVTIRSMGTLRFSYELKLEHTPK